MHEYTDNKVAATLLRKDSGQSRREREGGGGGQSPLYPYLEQFVSTQNQKI